MKKLKYQNLSKDALRVFLSVEDEILMNAAKRLSTHKDLLNEDDIESWQLSKLNQLGDLDKDNIKTISKYAELEVKEIEKLLKESGYSAVKEIETDLKKGAKQGLFSRAGGIEDSKVLLDILKAYEMDSKGVLNNINNTMLIKANVKYRNVINEVTGKVLTGVKTPHEALREVAGRWANMGIPSMVDKLGREWSTEAYVNMFTRSTASNVAHDMQDARMDEYGADLIEVSSHSGARPGCEPYQGQIYSRSGNNKNYPTIANTSIGDAAGLFGKQLMPN